MRKYMLLAALGLIMLMGLAAIPTTHVAHAQGQTITVAVDLGHGESDKYLNYIMSNITFVNWVVINTTLNESSLDGVDVFIIGQPTAGFTPDEMDIIYNWLQQGNKVLWVAGDSDYGSGNETQKFCNALLEYIGAKLRIEYASVYDDVHNAQRFYRVLFRVYPDNIEELNTSIISYNITKPILGHGPAPLIWQDENGDYHDIVNETFPGLVRIAWSYDTAYIGDNNPPLPLVYDPILYGQGTGNHTFVFIAAEYWSDLNDLIVVSGESPYGDYEPTWSPEYYGVPLDGPQFVTNMITWFKWILSNLSPGQVTPPAPPAGFPWAVTTTPPANTTNTTTTPPTTTTTPPTTTSPTTTTPPATTTTTTTTTTTQQTTTTTTTTTTQNQTSTQTGGGAGAGKTGTTGTTTPPKQGPSKALIATVIIIIVVIVAAALFLKG
ncbi:MAG: hypothetical protein F7C35_04980 [Desulfurococcales archaeon]|nr:hypothetical protein [Desulfurococcales archaeon]